MANLIRRTNGNSPIHGTPTQEWEPFRVMCDLFGFDPFRELSSFPITSAPRAVFVPNFDVKETKDGFVFTADLPGVKEKDLEVTMTGDRLTIAGKRESEDEEKGDTYYACERSYGTFSRVFTLPDGIDSQHVTADLKFGVLTLYAPKLPEVLPKKITVRPADKRS